MPLTHILRNLNTNPDLCSRPFLHWVIFPACIQFFSLGKLPEVSFTTECSALNPCLAYGRGALSSAKILVIACICPLKLHEKKPKFLLVKRASGREPQLALTQMARAFYLQDSFMSGYRTRQWPDAGTQSSEPQDFLWPQSVWSRVSSSWSGPWTSDPPTPTSQVLGLQHNSVHTQRAAGN